MPARNGSLGMCAPKLKLSHRPSPTSKFVFKILKAPFLLAFFALLFTAHATAKTATSVDVRDICEGIGDYGIGASDPDCQMYCNNNCYTTHIETVRDLGEAGMLFATISSAAGALSPTSLASCGYTATQDLLNSLTEIDIKMRTCSKDPMLCDWAGLTQAMKLLCTIGTCVGPMIPGGLGASLAAVCQLGDRLAKNHKCNAWKAGCNHHVINGKPAVLCAPLPSSYRGCSDCCQAQVQAVAECAGRPVIEEPCHSYYRTCYRGCETFQPGDPNPSNGTTNDSSGNPDQHSHELPYHRN